MSYRSYRNGQASSPEQPEAIKRHSHHSPQSVSGSCEAGGGAGGIPEAIEWPCLEFTLQLPGLEAKQGKWAVCHDHQGEPTTRVWEAGAETCSLWWCLPTHPYPGAL